MTDPVPARLRERHDRVTVVEQVHDVPPNEVHLVEVDGRRAVLKRSTGPRGDAAVVDEVAEFVRERPDRFVAAGDDGAEAESEPEPEPVLVHGWFSPEHVAVRDDTVCSVVDFEHAMAGAAEYDLWRLAIPTFGLGTEREDRAAWERFREAYESVRPLPAST